MRKTETALALFTVGFLILYFPVETWASWGYGLWSPFYLVDLIAMILLGWGAIRSLHTRPQTAPAVLCAGYGWAGANAWRALFGRLSEVRQGGQLDHGGMELCAVAMGTAVMLACFALSLLLVVRSSER